MAVLAHDLGQTATVSVLHPAIEVTFLRCRNSASSRGPRLLEEILRWGTTQLFDSSAAAAGRDAPAKHETAQPMDMDAGDALPGKTTVSASSWT